MNADNHSTRLPHHQSQLSSPQPMAGLRYTRTPSPPLTPPPLNLVGSPYWRAPLPPVSEPDYFQAYPHPSQQHYHHYQPTPISIHPILRYSFTPSISFDLSRHPSTITTSHDRRPLPIITLAEPATNPPLPALTIVSPHLPWPITVSARKPNRFVSVSDVFLALHNTLSLPASPSEYSSPTPSGALFRAHAAYAYDRRLQTSPQWRAHEGERRTWSKRIDFLQGQTRFMGLSTMGRDPGTWVLSTC